MDLTVNNCLVMSTLATVAICSRTLATRMREDKTQVSGVTMSYDGE